MADRDFPQPLKSLRDFRELIPGHRPGTQTHLSTLIRWCIAGVKTPAGERVKLRAVRVGSRWFTTHSWWTQFLDAQAGAVVVADGTSVPRSPAARRKAADRATAELAVLGGE